MVTESGFCHLEMWHFPSERSQDSRTVNGVVRLHNRPGDQTNSHRGLANRRELPVAAKGYVYLIFEGNFSGYDGLFTDTLTDTLPIPYQYPAFRFATQ